MEEQHKANLILHPLRIRILAAVSGARLTARQVASLLPDIPQTTLYRQINLLARHGLLTVVEERRVRGTVERVYQLEPQRATLTPADVAAASADDHLDYFAAYMIGLLGDFARYVRSRERLDVAADGVVYTKATLHLSDEELRAFQVSVQALLQPLLTHSRRDDRRAHLLALAQFPLAVSDEQPVAVPPDSS
jgi:DNA-binding transcriptional ArsR family regulator